MWYATHPVYYSGSYGFLFPGPGIFFSNRPIIIFMATLIIIQFITNLPVWA